MSSAERENIRMSASDPWVLVVEDDVALREMLVALLEMHGFCAAGASDRLEALAWLEAHGQDCAVVVLDLGLPPRPHSMDEGLMLLHQIRMGGLEARVIVLTGQAQQRSARASVGGGAFDFLPKPVEPERIVAAVERALLFWRTANELVEREGRLRLDVSLDASTGWRDILDTVQEDVLRRLWQRHQGNVSAMSRVLGVKRENLYPLLRKFGLVRRNDV